jgi:outer membrane lipoprotein-sorting protein
MTAWRRWLSGSLVVLLCTAVVGTPAALAAQSADSLLMRIAAARGGSGRLHTVRSQRLTGRIMLGPTSTGTIVVEQRRPNMIREEITIRGQTLVRAFDGETGWMQVPSGDTLLVQPLADDDLHNIAAEADFDGALIDPRVKGNRVELAGRDTIGGASVYTLRVMLRSGFADTWYVDSATALPLRWAGRRVVNGSTVEFESDFRDYLTVDGLKFARVIDTGQRDGSDRQQLIFDHVDINPVLESARFAMPSIAAPSDSAAAH